MEITDETIKKKHKEFNERVSAALNQMSEANKGAQFNSAIQRLRQRVQLGRSQSTRTI